MENLIYYLIGIGVLGLVYVFWKSRQVYIQAEGNQKLKDISSYIRSASFTFLKTEYKVMGAFIILIAVLLFLQSRSVEDSIILLHIINSYSKDDLGSMKLNLSFDGNEKFFGKPLQFQ